MKKLIIVAAVAMTALASNAAKCDWAIMPNAWSATTPASGDAYYVVFSSAIESTTDLGKALAAKNKDDILAALGNISESEKSAGTFATAYGNATGTINADLTSGSAFDVVVIAMNDNQFLVSNEASGQAYDPTATKDRVQASWTTMGAVQHPVTGTWTDFASVPEPTSGLMLLLGVGLMALKRRRT